MSLKADDTFTPRHRSIHRNFFLSTVVKLLAIFHWKPWISLDNSINSSFIFLEKAMRFATNSPCTFFFNQSSIHEQEQGINVKCGPPVNFWSILYRIYRLFCVNWWSLMHSLMYFQSCFKVVKPNQGLISWPHQTAIRSASTMSIISLKIVY